MPRNPVQLIDEDLKALRALRKIAQNEAALHSIKRIARECYHPNGNGEKPLEEDATPSRRGAVWATGIKKNAEKVLPTLRDKEFDYGGFIRALDQAGYGIAAKNARTAVGWVLRQLMKEGKVKLVKQGVGGKPSIYRVV